MVKAKYQAAEFLYSTEGIAAFVMPDEATRESINAYGQWFKFPDGSRLYIRSNLDMKAVAPDSNEFVGRKNRTKYYKGTIK